jgi:hypothetical protein
MLTNKSAFTGLLSGWLVFSVPADTSSEWVKIESNKECTYYRGTSKSGAIPLRAVCTWSIPATTIQNTLEEYDNHAEIFSQLIQSQFVSRNHNATLILQVHDFPGFTDRTAIMEFKSETIDNGKRIHFQKSSTQTSISPELIEVSVNNGSWEILETVNGSTVVFETTYSAGGYIPRFITNSFQLSAAKNIMTELKTYVNSPPQ